MPTYEEYIAMGLSPDAAGALAAADAAQGGGSASASATATATGGGGSAPASRGVTAGGAGAAPSAAAAGPTPPQGFSPHPTLPGVYQATDPNNPIHLILITWDAYALNGQGGLGDWKYLSEPTGTLPSTNVSVTLPPSSSGVFTLAEIQGMGAVNQNGVWIAQNPDGSTTRFDPQDVRGERRYNPTYVPRAGGTGSTPSPALRSSLGLGTGANVSGNLASPSAPASPTPAAPQRQAGAAPSGFGATNPLSHPLSVEQANAALDAFYASPSSNRTINRGLPFSSPWISDGKEYPVTLGGYVESGGFTPLSMSNLASPNPQFVGTGGLGLDSRAILQAAGMRSSGDPVKDAQLALNVSAARQRGYYPAAGEGEPTTPFLNLDTLASGAGGVKEQKAQQNYDYYGNPLPLGPSGFTGTVGVNQDLIY